MADFVGDNSNLLEDAPADVPGPFYHQERTGTLTEIDNAGSGPGVREIPALPRLVP